MFNLRVHRVFIVSILLTFVGAVGLANLNTVSADNTSAESSVTTAALEVETITEITGQEAEFCPSNDFQDVSTATQAGYPTPELNIYCNGDTMIVESNGIPTFEFVQITPTDLQAQNYAWQIPITPVESAEPADVPLGGAIGITVTGLPLFGPTEAPRDGYADPYLDGILDYCNGHTAGRGDYHFHARPDCLFSNIDGNPWLVIGYAFDGYPIMAPYVCTDASCTEIYKVDSSWERTSDVRSAWDAHEYVAGSGDLDECNGMTGADGQYRYYATDSFPYFIGCYHGVAATGNGPGGGAAGGQGGGTGQPGGAGNGAPPQGGRPGDGNGGPPRRQ